MIVFYLPISENSLKSALEHINTTRTAQLTTLATDVFCRNTEETVNDTAVERKQ